jgi:hypothetical protein
LSKYHTSNVPLTKLVEDNGGKLRKGFQLRYIYFIDKAYRNNLTVPIIPFSDIRACGAQMYKGKKNMPPVNGDIITTSNEGRFNPDPEALQ